MLLFYTDVVERKSIPNAVNTKKLKKRNLKGTMHDEKTDSTATDAACLSLDFVPYFFFSRWA